MSPAATITVRVPLAIRRRPGRKTVVTTGGVGIARTPTQADPTLLKALARAFRWQRMLDEGRYGSISEMAAAEKIERGYMGKMLRLTLLSPGIIEAIMDGRHPSAGGLPAIIRPLPELWKEHERVLAAEAATALQNDALIVPSEKDQPRRPTIATAASPQR